MLHTCRHGACRPVRANTRQGGCGAWLRMWLRVGCSGRPYAEEDRSLVLSQEETSPPPEDKSSQRCQKWKESRTRGQSLGGQGRAKNSPPVKQAPMREEPGMLQSVGLQRVGHDLVAEQQQQQRAEAEGGLGTWVTGRKQGALL